MESTEPLHPGMTVTYLGGLRCEGTHIRSGNRLTTDAPTDNQGRGEAFSPTDLMCTSLATCMLTLIGITAREKDIPLDEVKVDIEKIMGSSPRRVTGVRLAFAMNVSAWDEKQYTMIRHAAETCPVARSIHPDIKVELHWPEK
ncbi:MAG: OsmC family protein [Flavobacteriales bacterium]|jgi:putative redox protein